MRERKREREIKKWEGDVQGVPGLGGLCEGCCLFDDGGEESGSRENHVGQGVRVGLRGEER